MLFSFVFCSEDYNGNGLVSLAEMDGCVTVAGQNLSEGWMTTLQCHLSGHKVATFLVRFWFQNGIEQHHVTCWPAGPI